MTGPGDFSWYRLGLAPWAEISTLLWRKSRLSAMQRNALPFPGDPERCPGHNQAHKDIFHHTFVRFATSCGWLSSVGVSR